MSTRLRDVRTADLAAVHRLNESAVPHVGSITADTMRRFAAEAAYFRVATEDRAIVAFLIGLTPGADYDSMNFLWFRRRYDSFVYIDRIVVAEAARRRGIGLLLYRDLESFACPIAPVLTCEVNTRPPNEDSLAFHRDFGFERVGAQDTEGGRKTVALLVKKIVD